eukprot:57628-Prymnesium_polylepis.1
MCEVRYTCAPQRVDPGARTPRMAMGQWVHGRYSVCPMCARRVTTCGTLRCGARLRALSLIPNRTYGSHLLTWSSPSPYRTEVKAKVWSSPTIVGGGTCRNSVVVKPH